jgi:hypothetical protein
VRSVCINYLTSTRRERWGETIIQGVETFLLELLSCSGSLISCVGCLVVKYALDGLILIGIRHTVFKICMPAGEIQATCDKTSKCEIGLGQYFLPSAIQWINERCSHILCAITKYVDAFG